MSITLTYIPDADELENNSDGMCPTSITYTFDPRWRTHTQLSYHWINFLRSMGYSVSHDFDDETYYATNDSTD